MKRLIVPALFMIMLVIGYRTVTTSRYQPTSVIAPGLLIQSTTALPSATPTTRPTETVTPSPTIDYQVTAIIAQQTADEARRVNAIVTAEFEAREFAKTQLAHDEFMIMEQNKLASINATASLAPTSFAATQTQQFISNTQIAQKNQIIAAQMTATQYAPTQMVVMQNAQTAAKWGELNYIISMFAKAGIIIIMLCVVVYIFRIPVAVVQNNQAEETETEAELKQENVTRINLYTNNGAHSEAHDVPCSPDQLSEFAEKFLEGTTLRINNWEGSNTLWTRDVYIPFRAWMIKAGLVEEDVKPNGSSQIAPKPELSMFLRGWLDGGALPVGYRFDPHSPEDTLMPKDAENTDKNIMNMGIMGMRSGSEAVGEPKYHPV